MIAKVMSEITMIPHGLAAQVPKLVNQCACVCSPSTVADGEIATAAIR